MPSPTGANLTSPGSPNAQLQSPFFALLPPEIRTQIYSYIVADSPLHVESGYGELFRFPCRQLPDSEYLRTIPSAFHGRRRYLWRRCLNEGQWRRGHLGCEGPAGAACHDPTLRFRDDVNLLLACRRVAAEARHLVTPRALVFVDLQALAGFLTSAPAVVREHVEDVRVSWQLYMKPDPGKEAARWEASCLGLATLLPRLATLSVTMFFPYGMHGAEARLQHLSQVCGAGVEVGVVLVDGSLQERGRETAWEHGEFDGLRVVRASDDLKFDIVATRGKEVLGRVFEDSW